MAVRQTIQVRGVFRHTLDDKNRVIVPQSLRPRGAQELIIVQHPRSYLAVMTQEQFDELHSNLVQEFPEPDQHRDFGLVLNDMARRVSMDSQGRMSLSAEEVKHAGIDSVIIFTASGHRSQFEIWSPSRHVAAVQDKREAVGTMMQKLGI